MQENARFDPWPNRASDSHLKSSPRARSRAPGAAGHLLQLRHLFPRGGREARVAELVDDPLIVAAGFVLLAVADHSAGHLQPARALLFGLGLADLLADLRRAPAARLPLLRAQPTRGTRGRAPLRQLPVHAHHRAAGRDRHPVRRPALRRSRRDAARCCLQQMHPFAPSAGACGNGTNSLQRADAQVSTGRWVGT